MSDQLDREVVDYWNVQPPYRAVEGAEPGTLDWYRSISEHRYGLHAYMCDFVDFQRSSDADVLEIGCGAGTDLCEFARHGARVVGIDITDKAVELASGRLRAEGLPGTASRYDGQHLPFGEETFDLVYSWGVLHHSQHMEEIFAEAHRVLRPGGQLVLMLYNRRSFLYHYSILYLRGVLGQEGDLSRPELLSRYSEFREGCPLTRALTEAEVRDCLWYYSRVETTIDFPAYDADDVRKRPLAEAPNIPLTGVPDIDAFSQEFRRAREAGEDLRRFGWHLLVRATR